VETFHVSKDKKFKPQVSAGKLMLILLWDCNGLILNIYFKPTTAVTTAASYTKIFKIQAEAFNLEPVQQFADQEGSFAPK
jgi:hypothetical protein